MSKVILDPLTLARLRTMTEPFEVCDESGHTVGIFLPVNRCETHGNATSPISDEELNERRKRKTGRTLAEILKDLEAR